MTYLAMGILEIAWTVGVLSGMNLMARLLAGIARSFTDDAGTINFEYHVANPLVVWNFMWSPGYALLTIFLLFGGWYAIWFIYSPNRVRR